MAALVEQALKDGRLKINPDRSLNVDGIKIPPAPPASVGLAATNPEFNNKFWFDGENWTLQFDGETVVETDRLGLRYIGQMLSRPHKEIYATNLVTGAYGESTDIIEAKNLVESGVAITEATENEIADGVDLQVITSEFHDEILPDENRAFVFGLLEKEYKFLAKLQKKGTGCEVLKQKEKIKADIQEIKKYLASHRYHGKNVCFDSRAEKDRKSVSKAIKETIQKIALKHPTLAEHLRKTIETGIYCSYQPEVEIQWQVAEKWCPVSACSGCFTTPPAGSETNSSPASVVGFSLVGEISPSFHQSAG